MRLSGESSNNGMLWLVVLVIIGIIAASVSATAVYLPSTMRAAAIEAAYRSNIEIAEQIKITRGYYARNIVAKALRTRALTPSMTHAGNPNAIPLPATFVKDISDLLKEKDTSLALVSPYPWPHRADRKMNEFENKAWKAFQKNPKAIFSRQEIRDGKRVLRVAVADVMTSKTCVNCHNTHPQSTKTDWKVGDVRAVMEVMKVVEPYLAAADQRSNKITWTVVGLATIVAFVLLAVTLLVTLRTREKRKADRNVYYLAHHDPLTGVLNRATFMDRLDAALRRRMATRNCLAVHYIDLDGFKEINDKFGHSSGDELIQCAAKRLQTLCSSDTLIARLGGDEFAVAQLSISNEDVAKEMASSIVAALSETFALAQHQVRISASVGVMIATPDTPNAQEIVKAADIALYKAKADGRQRYMFFTREMREQAMAHRKLKDAIRLAAREDGFELHFQPICSAKTCALEGFEALLRLPDGEGGFIPPSIFVPVAEEIGLISEIGEWVINHACEVATSWPGHLTVAVNLSPEQFKARRSSCKPLSSVVQTALAASGLEAHRLELEITENVFLETSDEVVSEMHRLKEIGVRLVMDDFGTGYSSLSYLCNLPLDKIKIDQSFTAASANSHSKVDPILESITTLGHVLQMQVTAEGIETREQANHFSALSCDQLQGYLLSRPIPQSELPAAILRNYATRISSIAVDQREGQLEVL